MNLNFNRLLHLTKNIIVIYLFFWILDEMFTKNDYFIEIDLNSHNSYTKPHIYGGSNISGGNIVYENRLKINEIQDVLTKTNNIYILKNKKGRLIIHLKKYTSGSIWLDILPFAPFKNNYKIVNNREYKSHIGSEDYFKYFNFFKFSLITYYIVITFFVLFFIGISIRMKEFNLNKSKSHLNRIAHIAIKAVIICFIVPQYYKPDLLISFKIFMGSIIMHIALLYLLYSLLQMFQKNNKNTDPAISK